jgi:hypothetical protein
VPKRVIWKIQLPDPGDLHHAALPGAWRVVAAGVQDGAHVAWVEVEPDRPVVERPVHVLGTGWPIPDEMYGADVRLEHRATYQWGVFVWHVYEGVVTPPW